MAIPKTTVNALPVKDSFHNSWVTDQKVSKQNIVELGKAGRARWKIENETFYTLKNQGYHLEETIKIDNVPCGGIV